MTGARSNDPVSQERQAEKRRERRRKLKQKINAEKMQDLQSDTNEDTEMHDESGDMSTSRHPGAAPIPPKERRSELKKAKNRDGVIMRMKKRTRVSKDATAEENAARKALWKDYIKNRKIRAGDRKKSDNDGGEVGQQEEGNLIVGSSDSMSGVKDIDRVVGEGSR